MLARLEAGQDAGRQRGGAGGGIAAGREGDGESAARTDEQNGRGEGS